jgi:hypothetical protein
VIPPVSGHSRKMGNRGKSPGTAASMVSGSMRAI